MDNNARSAKAGRPSTTANVELLDGRTLVGLFGDYVRAPRRERRKLDADLKHAVQR